jgi:hypothetical protein
MKIFVIHKIVCIFIVDSEISDGSNLSVDAPEENKTTFAKFNKNSTSVIR